MTDEQHRKLCANIAMGFMCLSFMTMVGLFGHAFIIGSQLEALRMEARSTSTWVRQLTQEVTRQGAARVR